MNCWCKCNKAMHEWLDSPDSKGCRIHFDCKEFMPSHVCNDGVCNVCGRTVISYDSDLPTIKVENDTIGMRAERVISPTIKPEFAYEPTMEERMNSSTLPIPKAYVRELISVVKDCQKELDFIDGSKLTARNLDNLLDRCDRVLRGK